MKETRSRTVLVREWDSGRGGSWGISWIREKDGRYFYGGVDEDTFGPFRTLEQAIRWSGINHVNDTTVRIDSVLPTDQAAALLVVGDYDPQVGYTLPINGEPWDWDPETSSFRPGADEPVVVDRDEEGD